MPAKSRTLEELFVADNLTPEKAKLVLALQGRRADLYDDDARMHKNKHAKEKQSTEQLALRPGDREVRR